MIDPLIVIEAASFVKSHVNVWSNFQAYIVFCMFQCWAFNHELAMGLN